MACTEEATQNASLTSALENRKKSAVNIPFKSLFYLTSWICQQFLVQGYVTPKDTMELLARLPDI